MAGRGSASGITRDRAWQLGLAVGAAAGIAGRYVAQRLAHDARRKGLVDWERVDAIASTRLRRSPGALGDAAIKAAEPSYARAMERVVPLLEQHLGTPLPGVAERYTVVTRSGWARANLGTLQQLVSRVETQLMPPIDARDPGLAPGIAAAANRFLSTQQVAFLLGYLGSRVLGQYDVALLSAETPPGRLLFVEENIRATAMALGVPLDDFRTWICLHETTHAFEMEAHPWVRPYLAERLERQLASFLDDARTLQAKGLGELWRRWRRPGGGLLDGFLTEEQRRLLRETQLMMSLIEGFSDWAMDEVGAQLLPDVRVLRERFEARRDQRRRGLDRFVARITGMDMKLEQYRRGERFVSGVARIGGREALARLWEGPASLPSERELADPAEWVRRMAGPGSPVAQPSA